VNKDKEIAMNVLMGSTLVFFFFCLESKKEAEILHQWTHWV